MKTLPTYFRTLVLLLTLATVSPVAQAARPAKATPVEQRATGLTRYLARTLQLSRAQQKAVQKSTRTYLQQLDLLAVKPGLVAAAGEGRLLSGQSRAQIEQEYDNALARVFTPGQYTAYSWLRERQPEGSR